MSEVRLPTQPRTDFGKGGARRTRRAGLVPAVIYGHGAEPRHISIPSRDFTQALKAGGANVLLTLDIDGKDEFVIPKAIQRHPIKSIFEHVDLLAVRRGEKVTVDVPIVVTGDVAAGGLLEQEAVTVSLEAEATHLPTEIIVDISALEVGAHVTMGDLVLPTGSSLVVDADYNVLVIHEARAQKSEAEEAAEAAAEAAE